MITPDQMKGWKPTQAQLCSAVVPLIRGVGAPARGFDRFHETSLHPAPARRASKAAA